MDQPDNKRRKLESSLGPGLVIPMNGHIIGSVQPDNNESTQLGPAKLGVPTGATNNLAPTSMAMPSVLPQVSSNMFMAVDEGSGTVESWTVSCDGGHPQNPGHFVEVT